ncbi:2-oxoglutarate and iron-dependent oxygenase domain-containing protein CP2-like isoform X4 [Rosa rugosa]|uniref:2-oxoglutarate and iron-dependent oxygenase domain-containing protein CP2-like isoform X4 n=1 Tax=Rosa rugosa TaxID=74645 RepID=UPI002B40B8A7|nr:2-oxoglutarate and iron-dependent oxygenase domain-containing protein CP2-like isoform X4 [Rosa rugosa]
MDGSQDGSKPPPQTPSTANGNGVASMMRLRLKPEKEHKSDSYQDLQQLEFSPLLFSSLEHYLPANMLNVPRELKLRYMREILLRYSTEGERTRIQRHREYRERITSNYQSLHEQLYTMQAEQFFVPSFLNAVNEGTEDSFRSIMAEPSPGVFTFEMLQPQFCELLVSEVENFERWVHETRFRIMRPNTMNKYGAVLDDFGFETMLDKLMEEFIRPISRVLFPEVGGATLDSHHGFVVEYGIDRDVELGFHVDDAEVTLNVCLGKQFTGGELYFRGVRCDKHVNSETLSEEVFDYPHVPGYAVLHRGRHRHGARATISGRRVNLLLWCRSSVFRELRKYQKDCSNWCGDCHREKKERQRQSVAATKLCVPTTMTNRPYNDPVKHIFPSSIARQVVFKHGFNDNMISLLQ